MPGPVRQSSLVNETARDDANVGGALVNSVASGSLLVAVVAAFCNTSVASGNIVSGYGTTIGGSPSNTWALAARSAQTVGVWRTEVTIWVAHNVAAGNTTGKPTFTASTNEGHSVWHHMDEWTGMATSSSVDKTATTSAADGAGAIATTATATLAQADEVVYCAAACRYNYLWNGDYDAPGAPPTTGFTVLQGTTNNATLLVAQSAYKEVASTAGVSASWAYAEQSGDLGAVAALATLKKSTTSLRLEIDDVDTADITGTTGWTFGAWPANPFQTGSGGQCAKVWSGYSATLDGTTLVFPDAPPGASVDDVYNVSGHQPSGTLNFPWSTGTVREAS